MTHRLSININEETETALKDMASREDITITELVRRMTATYKFFTEQQRQGSQPALLNSDGSMTRVVFL